MRAAYPPTLFQILAILKDREPRTKRHMLSLAFELGPTSLDRSLQRATDLGWVKRVPEAMVDPDATRKRGAPPIYYTLTREGREAAEENAAHFETVLTWWRKWYPAPSARD